MLPRTIGCCLVFAAGLTHAADPQPGPSTVLVEGSGVLRDGVVATGGEHTGTSFKSAGVTWELQLSDDASREFAAAHHKKPVFVSGALRRVKGVQIPVRWIIDVDKISPRDPDEKDGLAVTFTGKLRTAAEGDPAAVIEADGIAWSLDLSAAPALQDQAAALNQKLTIAKGLLEHPAGAAHPDRMLIRVSKLAAPARGARQ